MKTNMKPNELFTLGNSDLQPVCSQTKKCHQSSSHYVTSTQNKAASNSDYVSTGYASNDADYSYKALSMSSSDEIMTNNELDYKRSHNSAESRESEDISVHSEVGSIDNGYKKMRAMPKSIIDNKPTLTEKLSQSDAVTDQTLAISKDTHKKPIPKKETSMATMQSSEIPERVFMNSLVKHTAIALAIIVPLAAISAYAAPQAMPINKTQADKTTTETIEVEPSTIIHKSADEPTTVDSIDLKKYAGTWYEIGRLPMYFQRKCASDVTATYTEKADGSGITVLNKCMGEDGKAIDAEGLAKPVDDTGSKLKVTFLPSWIRWLPVGRADYWVLAHDPSYQTALVGTPDKDYLWLLARSPNISQKTYAKYRQIAQQQGYGLKEFKLTTHAKQTVKLIP